MAVSQQCAECKHYTGSKTCPAFPTGIPKKFFVGYVKHDTIEKYQISEVIYELDSAKKALSSNFINVIKGGQGSGNWGHEGQEGSWGGSSETGGTSEEFLQLDPEMRHSFDPQTAEFSESRFLEYCDDMEQEEYEEYLEKLDEHIDKEQKDKLPDVPNPEPGQFKTSTQAEKWLGDKYNITGDFTTPIYMLHTDTKKKIHEESDVVSWAEIDDSEFVDLDMEVVNDSLDEFDRLAEKHPYVADKLEYIGTYADEEKFADDFELGMWSPADYGHSFKDGTKIGLNPEYFGDKEVLHEHVKHDVNKGFHPDIVEDKYITSVMTHEFGHQVFNSLIEEDGEFHNKYGSDTIISTIEQGMTGQDFGFTDELHEWHIPDMVEDVTKEHHGGYLNTFFGQPVGFNSAETLSEYSKQSPEETFAENFLASEHGTEEQKDQPIVRSFDEMMDRVDNSYTEDEVTSLWSKSGEIHPDDSEKRVEEFRELVRDFEKNDSPYSEIIHDYKLEQERRDAEKSTLQDNFINVIKGGQGSGNWGHEGQAGSWGGSSETGGTSEEFLEIDPEYRHSFDPQTGEFDEERHNEYWDKLAEEEGIEVAREYDKEIDELLWQEKYGEEKIDLSQFIDEEGKIDVDKVREETTGIGLYDAYDRKLEVMKEAVESREQIAKEKKYEILSEVDSVEAPYEMKSLFDEYPMLADDEDFADMDGRMIEIGDYSETLNDAKEEEIMKHLEEFNSKETLGEQQRYLDEEVVVPSLNFDDPENQLDFETRNAREFLKKSLGNEIEEKIFRQDAIDDPPGLVDELEGINPYLVEQENPAQLPLTIHDKTISTGLSSYRFDDPEAVAENFKENVEKGKEFIEKYANGDYNKLEKPLDVVPATGRGYYDEHFRKIGVSLGSDADGTTIHELGHVLHKDSMDKRLAVEVFFKDRIEGEEMTTIHTTQDGQVERGYKDEFISHYTGKVYHDDVTYGTEVFSTGLQALYDDPEKFRQQDEEHFLLTLSCLEGLF